MSGRTAMTEARPPLEDAHAVQGPEATTARRSARWRELVPAIILLGGVLWVARFWHSADFGFYEDDYTLVTRAMASDLPQLLEDVAAQWIVFLQGRPLQPTMVLLLSFVAGRLGGLPEAYWLGYGILFVNATLGYLLFRRLLPPGAALLGSLAFVLFPADTTQIFLSNSLGQHLSITWFLLATHAYLSGKETLSYGLIFGSLLSYETIFPVFLAVPLLRGPSAATPWRRLTRHALILAVIFVIVLAVRVGVGEGRVAGLGFPGILTTPLVHMAEGPIVALGTFFYRPVQVALAMDTEIGIALAVASVCFVLILARAHGEPHIDAGEALRSLLRWQQAPALSDEIRKLLRLGLVGLLMLVLAYPLTFTVRAYAISGRDTRVHFAAVVGASILWAVFSWLLLGVAESIRKQWLAASFLGLILGGLLGFGFLIQRDYVRSWELQRSFWAQVVRLCPDLEEGTVILVEPDAFEDTRQIAANHWNLPRVLNQIYTFPAEWDEPPRVYRLEPGWQQSILGEGDVLTLDASTVLAPPSLYGQVESTRVIYLTGADGVWERASGPLFIEGQQLPLKPSPAGTPVELQPGPLYPYLIDEAESVTWALYSGGRDGR